MDDARAKQLIDQGRIIQAGWEGFVKYSYPPTVSEMQKAEMRNCFFAGAQHLFGSIIQVLGPEGGNEEKDMQRLDSIAKELETFISVYMLNNVPTKGNG